MIKPPWWTLALALCLTLSACGDDASKTPVRSNNANPDMPVDMTQEPDQDPDMAPDQAPDMVMEPDMEPDQDPDMALDGQMKGTWTVTPAAGGEVIVTLVLMHDRDQVPVLGTFQMGGADGQTGELANASYINNQFSAQWNTTAGQHLLNMGIVSGADGTATYVSPESGGIGAQVKLTRTAK